MILLPFSAWLPYPERIPHPEDFFKNAKEDFRRFADAGYFREVAEPALYVYQIEQHGRTHLGLVGTLDLSTVTSGRVCPHEQTFPDQVERQLQLLQERRAAVKPVLLTYPPRPALSLLLRELAAGEPLLEMTPDGADERHRLWPVKLPRALQAVFDREVERLVIADGHHRLRASSALYERDLGGKPSGYHQLLCAFFSTDQLDIHNYNRIIRLETAEKVNDLLERLRALATITPLAGPAAPRAEHELVLYSREQWYRLRWHAPLLAGRAAATGACLDTQLLQDLVIQETLQPEHAGGQVQVEFVEGPRGLEGLRTLVNARAPAVGVVLHPIDPATFIELSETGCLLPPKSTWFEPRMLNGLIVQPLAG